MATVTVHVNGRPYPVGCEDGQEAHVAALAQAFDRQVREVGQQVGQVGDLRLFLMAALILADEVQDARARLAEGGSGADARDAATALNSAAARIEALTERLG